MEPSLFSFIWRHSRRQQMGLLVLTVLTFPFLYATLELPKRIVNDAIGAPSERVGLWGWNFSPEGYLVVLCVGFLVAVLLSGLLKMRLNTLKGVLAERLLRRLRYQLISRMMRFPTPYFRTTSQGEMVSMITAESEPMGGLMGDAVAQPVFQAGQMLTIVAFLFMQSVWFGLASIALIPLQAWLIPMLQRQINLLNKDRIQEVRALSAQISETAAGISDLRANGGWRYRLAQVSDRLGHLFEIRKRIYMKKFFMKFLNNLIGHMTPFFFYLIGGLLAIKGEITVGALVAALAAYKDLSAPWKELLTYYNQVQDMSLRWAVMTEKFAPDDMIDAALFDGSPREIPSLRGEITLTDVLVRDSEGKAVLDGLNLTIPKGARVAIQSTSDAERAAFAHLLTRDLLPERGRVTIGSHDLAALHQGVIAARIGHAYSNPYLFDGSLGDNVLMPLRNRPDPQRSPAQLGQVSVDTAQIEAVKSGNSPDPLDADWISPELAGISDEEGLRNWWFQLVEAMGIDGQLFQRTLHTRLQERHRLLEQQITALRPDIERKLEAEGLRDVVFRFVEDRYNPTLTLAENLLFAFPVAPIPEELFTDFEGPFQTLLRAEGLDQEVREISLGWIAMLQRTFGRDHISHPLFQRLGLNEDLWLKISAAADRRKARRILRDEEKALLSALPFLVSEELFAPGLPEAFKARVVALRKPQGDRLLAQSRGVFRRLDSREYGRKLTVLENALFGRVSSFAGAKADAVEDAVAEVLDAHDLRARLALMIYDLPTGLGGALLEPVFRERAAFTRAAIKRPDVLVLDRALASHDADSRQRSRTRLRELLPKTTMIFMEDHFENPDRYDLFVALKDGRVIEQSGGPGAAVDDMPAGAVGKGPSERAPDDTSGDFDRKLSVIRSVDLFTKLDSRNRRLLAFSAQWHPVAEGDAVFRAGDAGDAVFLCLSGRAELRWPDGAIAEEGAVISEILPGRLIGDLAVILEQSRALDLIATEDSMYLRIGASEYRAVIESDPRVAMELLKTVSGHLLSAADALQQERAAKGAID